MPTRYGPSQPDRVRTSATSGVLSERVLNKVPEVTIWFWIIKILCTTVGESAADYLNYNLNWGLTKTSVFAGVLFCIVLAWQLALRRYVAGVYWATVVLVSVFGTLVTDNLTDNLGVPLEASTIVFSVLLGLVFIAWYAREGTLSIHSIYTRRRELFYWLAILFTFALGTATGDLVSEGLGVGYFRTGVLCLLVIGAVTLAWRLGLNAVLAFWIAYILTRPLGASLGDFLAQPISNGGLGLGVTVTSAIFLTLILLTIIFLSIRKPDVIAVPSDPQRLAELDEPETAPRHHLQSRRSALIQTIVVVALFIVVGGGFYAIRTSQLNAQAQAATAATPGQEATGGTETTVSPSPLGDLSVFIVISQDTLSLLNQGRQAEATTRITDLESAWDSAAAILKRRNPDEWTAVDTKIDRVLRELRSTSPDAEKEKAALRDLLQQMGGPPGASLG
ncbi:MAG: hypothetical protein KGP12_10550 [Actinomycetales bacterium]|nr:hypothetical protein [Actinomycetales bacterium]